MDYLKRKDLVIRMFNQCRVSVAVLARESGVDYQRASKILKGERPNPTSDDIDALYHVLKKKELGQ